MATHSSILAWRIPGKGISLVNSLGKIYGVTALHQLHSGTLNKMVKSPRADGADVQMSDDACLVALI